VKVASRVAEKIVEAMDEAFAARAQAARVRKHADV
jgi:hypothetical protein